MRQGKNECGDLWITERGTWRTVHVTRDGGEVGKTIHQRTDYNLQRSGQLLTTSLLTTCNNSTIYWNVAIWRFQNCFHLQAIDCSGSSINKIIHNVLDFQKLSSRWVLHLLTDEHIKNRMGATLLFLSAYKRAGVWLIRRIIMRWDLHPLLHIHEQATKYNLMWTWWSCTKGSQDTTQAKIWQLNFGTGRAFYFRSPNNILRKKFSLWKLHVKILIFGPL